MLVQFSQAADSRTYLDFDRIDDGLESRFLTKLEFGEVFDCLFCDYQRENQILNMEMVNMTYFRLMQNL